MEEEYFVKRTKEDDFLDSLTLKINHALKTEKEIKNQQNNVYFWIIKFGIVLLYVLIINGIFGVFSEIGTNLIYYFGISLRSILSFVWNLVMMLSKGMVTLYILMKNLRLFLNSPYYKRLYSRDHKMKKKKEKLFGTIHLVLKVLIVPFLLTISFVSALLLAIFTMLIYLLINGVYSISLLFFVLVLFCLCYLVFRDLQFKFFDSGKTISGRNYVFVFASLIFAIILLGYEFGNYTYSDTFPTEFSLQEKTENFDIKDKKEIVIRSTSKYDNVDILLDNSLEDTMRVEWQYYETTTPKYTNYLQDDDSVQLLLGSEMNFHLSQVPDVLRFMEEVIRNQTMYNYNLFKYPSIHIYVGEKDFEKMKVLSYEESFKELEP